MSSPAEPVPSDPSFVEMGRLAVLGRLTRGVAHEINNPLFVVLALAELLARAVEPGSQAADRLAQVQESGLEIRRLLSALQDVARPDVGTEAGPLAVAPVLLEAVDLVRRVSLRKDLDVVERYADDGAVVLAGRGELRLAFLAILVDAQEATVEGGSIDVSTACRGERVNVLVRWSGGAPSAGRLEALDRLPEAIVAAWGGTLGWSEDAAGSGEALVSLPLYADT